MRFFYIFLMYSNFNVEPISSTFYLFSLLFLFSPLHFFLRSTDFTRKEYFRPLFFFLGGALNKRTKKGPALNRSSDYLLRTRLSVFTSYDYIREIIIIIDSFNETRPFSRQYFSSFLSLLFLS